MTGDALPGDMPADLARLTMMAAAVREHTSTIVPSPAFRAGLRAELLAAPGPTTVSALTRARDRVDVATARWRHSLRVAVAAATAGTLIGTTAVAAAAQAALPGDLLYGVKGFTEDARMAFTSGDVDRGRLHLQFAQVRLGEVEDGVERLAPAVLATTLGEMDTAASTGADDLLAVAQQDASRGDLLVELNTFTTQTRTRLLDLTERLPLGAVAAAEQSLEVLRRIDLQVEVMQGDAPCDACDAEGEPDPVAAPRVVMPGDGPAVPRGCDCVGQVPAASPRPEPAPEPQPVPSPEPEPTPEPEVVEPSPPPDDPEPTPPPETERGLGQLLDPVGDVGSIVDDVLGTDIEGTVDDVATEVDAVEDELSDLLDPGN